MSDAPPGALVLGVGNVLMGDEGVGVAVVRSLERSPEGLPEGTRLVDGGTLGLDLLPIVEGAGALVLVDAVELGGAPGTVAVLSGDQIGGRLGGQVSSHQIGLADLLAAARLTGALPERVALVGIQPGAVDVGLELSAAVQAAIPEAADAVRRELAAFAVVAAPG